MILRAQFKARQLATIVSIETTPGETAEDIARRLLWTAGRVFVRRGVLVRQKELRCDQISDDRRAIDAAGRQIWTSKGTECNRPHATTG